MDLLIENCQGGDKLQCVRAAQRGKRRRLGQRGGETFVPPSHTVGDVCAPTGWFPDNPVVTRPFHCRARQQMEELTNGAKGKKKKNPQVQGAEEGKAARRLFFLFFLDGGEVKGGQWGGIEGVMYGARVK